MQKTQTSTNPYTGKKLKSYALLSIKDIELLIQKSDFAQKEWTKKSINKRNSLLNNLSNNLENNKGAYANLITQEMGKPISESIAEIEKCIWLSDFYSHNAEAFLADEIIETDAHESFISKDPLGCILGIMPWNYPFWQVLRFAIPTLVAGNAVLVKHASNVSGCALAIEKLFKASGFPNNTYTALITNHEAIEAVISNSAIKAVSLTGSEAAGRAIAEIAGKHLKKTVLELGGTNACIVLADANLDKYIKTMVNARYQNNGQSCIAAKRFIVVDAIYEEFLNKFKIEVSKLTIGDPTSLDTEISVLAKEEFTKSLKEQVENSIKKGAKINYGNSIKKAHYQPTIITEVTPEMSVFKEEIFGPIAAITKAKNTEDAFRLNTLSTYGLGTMLFTEDIQQARHYISAIEDGAFFINDMVKSDPRLPFGGTKNSGYGRELSKEGILEFINKKTIYIKK